MDDPKPRRRSRLRQWGAAALLATAVLAVGAGCSGDDDATATATGTAVAEATDTASATASPDATETATAEAGAAQIGLELVASDLTAPVYLTDANDGTDRLFVVEQSGVIRVRTADGEMAEEPFLDITDQLVEVSSQYDERGLLGLAFHPEFQDNGRFFVYYSAPLRADGPADWNHTSRLSEFTVSADNPDLADASSERVLMEIDQPQFNHNGGHITFGDDGYLYIPLGDGGAANDVGEGHNEETGNGQDLSVLLGKVLRIDIDAPGDEAVAYGIPADNPFVGGGSGARPEIWAYGLRNPYDISFDPTGEYGLLISDAGQDLFEEVSLATGGENFGWHIKEGTHCFDPETPDAPPAECATEGALGEPLVDPVVEYHHEDAGLVVTGAQIYRGDALPALSGKMIVVEWSATGAPDGLLMVADPNGDLAATGEDEGLWPLSLITVTTALDGADEGTLGRYITGLMRDSNNELYILVNRGAGPEPGSGEVYRLVAATE